MILQEFFSTECGFSTECSFYEGVCRAASISQELKFPSKVLQTWQNIQHWKEALIQILALSACEYCRDSEMKWIKPICQQHY